MEILITGANGFLGREIVNSLKNENSIKTLSRTSGDFKIFLEDEIPDFRQKFDLVIHAAGKAHIVPRTDEEKKKFHNVNVIGTQNLLTGLAKFEFPNQFIYISSVSVYGMDSGTNIDENYPLNAKDPYGLSKIEAEKIVMKWCTENNIICTILRLPLLVGKNPPGNLGSMLKGIRKGYYFNIQQGKARKSMVLIGDVASFIIKVAPIGGIYNLTDCNHPSFGELSNVISERMGKRKPLSLPFWIAKFLGRLGDFFGDKSPINSLKVNKIVSDLTFDDTKAKVSLNWKPNSVIDYLRNNDL